MPFNIQGPELIVLLIIALLVLGPGKLPEVGSALGKSIREFRKAATDVKEAASIEPVKPAPASEPRAVDAPSATRHDTQATPPPAAEMTPPGPVASAATPAEPGPTGAVAASDTDKPAA